MRLPVKESVLADFARSKFSHHGRGAVVVEEGGTVRTLDGEKHGTTLAYLYEGSDLLARAGGRWPGTTKIAVETYDPEREMVVIVLPREGDLEAYLLPLADAE
jgi:hypothetical protein